MKPAMSPPPRTRRIMSPRLALFLLGGAAVGFLYYRFVGCRSGTCAITSNPYISTLYGAVLGLLLGGSR